MQYVHWLHTTHTHIQLHVLRKTRCRPFHDFCTNIFIACTQCPPSNLVSPHADAFGGSIYSPLPRFAACCRSTAVIPGSGRIGSDRPPWCRRFERTRKSERARASREPPITNPKNVTQWFAHTHSRKQHIQIYQIQINFASRFQFIIRCDFCKYTVGL